jgi:plastocyanin
VKLKLWVGAAALAVGLTGTAAAQEHPGMESEAGEGSPPTCEAGGSRLSIAADDLKFDKDCLAVGADSPFTIRFTNKEKVSHNVEILRAHDSDEALYTGGIFPGPRSVTYEVPALPAGSYHFHCQVHPTDMQGRFIVGDPDAPEQAAAVPAGPPSSPGSSSTVTTAAGPAAPGTNHAGKAGASPSTTPTTTPSPAGVVSPPGPVPAPATPPSTAPGTAGLAAAQNASVLGIGDDGIETPRLLLSLAGIVVGACGVAFVVGVQYGRARARP